LVGAGGGGFLLVADHPSLISEIKLDFSMEDYIDFELHMEGTSTSLYD
jgi:galactokinase/mevalonate kinase-like predicted kinase